MTLSEAWKKERRPEPPFFVRFKCHLAKDLKITRIIMTIHQNYFFEQEGDRLSCGHLELEAINGKYLSRKERKIELRKEVESE